MKRFVAIAIALVALAPLGARAGSEVLLTVADGEFFYDGAPGDGVCRGDNNDARGQALRHWHVGIPFAGANAEVAGGFGCLGGPKSWTVTIDEGMTGRVAGTLDYTWDTNVPGGCCNDVHLHVTQGSDIVASTLFLSGPQPVIPVVAQPRRHSFNFTLAPGTYTITEDVFSGEHSAWLSNFTVVQGEVVAQ